MRWISTGRIHSNPDTSNGPSYQYQYMCIFSCAALIKVQCVYQAYKLNGICVVVDARPKTSTLINIYDTYQIRLKARIGAAFLGNYASLSILHSAPKQ